MCSPRTPAARVVVLLLLFSLVTGCSSVTQQTGARNGIAPNTLPPYRAAAPATLRAAEDDAGPAQRQGGRIRPGVPRAVAIPRLALDVPVIGITAPGGTLTPPSNPQMLGWWSPGARPGAARGSALITGHTVSSGGGAFNDLEQLRAGDRVSVRTSAGTVEYAVREVSIYRTASLARKAEELFSQTVPGRLVLVTCEDWNGEVYLSNVVVIAHPVDAGAH